MRKVTVWSDGGARGNPGPAAIGVFIKDEQDNILEEISETIGETTNNIAEYTAVLRGLQVLRLRFGDETKNLEIAWKLDSELVERQLSGIYKIKNPGLRDLYSQIQDLRAQFPQLVFVHVRREFNKEADQLVNEALDKE